MSSHTSKKYKHFYGDLHTHTGFSDGQGTPKEAFKWAKESRRGDFLAVSDHADRIDQRKWEATLKAAQEATDETFVALASVESGYSEEYIDEDGVAVVNGGELNLLGVSELIVESGYPTNGEHFGELLKKQEEAIAFFNHPQEASWPTDKIWNAYKDFEVLNPEENLQIVGVEVSNETGAYNDLHELVYSIALDKGWRFAPFANSDTHSGKWLSGFDDRTVVLAEALTAKDLLEAFRQRRFYAVQNPSFQIEFEVNGQVMGSVLEPSCIDYEIKIEVENRSPKEGEAFKCIQLISDNGEVVAEKLLDSFYDLWQFGVASTTAHYYFVRVVNQLGEKIWTAPIWTGRKAKIWEPVQKGIRIPMDKMSICEVSSEKVAHQAKEVLNLDTKTWWEAEGPMGELLLDLGEIKNIVGIGYRKNYIHYEDKEALAKLLDCYEYEIRLEQDGEAIHKEKGRILNYGKEHYTHFESVKGRYIYIKAKSIEENATVAIGNIFIYTQ